MPMSKEDFITSLAMDGKIADVSVMAAVENLEEMIPGALRKPIGGDAPITELIGDIVGKDAAAMEGMAPPGVTQGGRSRKEIRFDEGKFRALHRAGWTDGQIAEEMKMSKATAQRKRVEMGLPAVGRQGRKKGKRMDAVKEPAAGAVVTEERKKPTVNVEFDELFEERRPWSRNLTEEHTFLAMEGEDSGVNEVGLPAETTAPEAIEKATGRVIDVINGVIETRREGDVKELMAATVELLRMMWERV